MLLRVSKFLLHVSLFSVVIVLTTTFFPFIGGKDYFFRFAVELSLIFFILWWAFEAEEGESLRRLKEVFSKPLFIAVSVFVLTFFLASIFADDPRAAFWSNYERGEGGFQMLHYYAFFSLLVFLMEKKEDWRLFFKTSLIAATMMILYGIFANLGWADNFISPYQSGSIPEGLWKRLVATRFQGSLGNPAYVAPYLIFSLFYTFYLWASNRSQLKVIYGAGYGILALIFFFFLIISGTRGAFLGLSVSIFFFLIYLALSHPLWRKWFAIALAVFILGTGILWYNRQSAFVQSLPGGRIFDISLSVDSAQTRLWTWGSATKGFFERPILGWGPENFTAVFDKHFDPRHFNPGKNSETWFDRAHSMYFGYLSETGILGLASYLTIYLVFYWGFFRGKTKDSEYSAWEKALLFALPAGYLVQGLAIFEVLPMYINIFLFFAFSYFFLYHHSHQHKNN
ncbi:MAG: O-antigen ligase family protein [bacterium]|nr:O-antigen ligase family protein [bacterium]